MKDKYLFRVYQFDDKGNIVSPFLGSESKFGEKQVTDTVQSDVGNATTYGALFHKGQVYPKTPLHKGFSAIGKVDPRFSIWVTEDAHDFDDDVLEAVQKQIRDVIPEDFKNKREFANRYADNEKNDYEYFTNPVYSPWELTHGLSKLSGVNQVAKMYSLDPKYFDFDSDTVWDDLAYDIDSYGITGARDREPDEEGSRIVLATAPEDKIITVDDVVKQGLTQQRDFPQELVTTEITPIREFTEYPEAFRNYLLLRRKGASGKEAFADSFKLEPGEIVSDENMKNIYKDMCFFINGSNRQNNILKGLKELGQ